MSEIAIKVENVSKVYKMYEKPKDRFLEALGMGGKESRHKDHYALDSLSFEVRKGETVGIIGTNGAGKSTILKIITGVLSPTSGAVNIDGRISALLELGAGFNMEYSGIENIYLNGTMIGFSREEIDERMKDILDFADIGEFVHHPVKTYSSGMFVRLAFAVAINIDPEILVIDEALSVGDVFFQAKCFKKFEEFRNAGKTILFVSHDTGSMQRYCDRVILLDKGKKKCEGKSKEVIDIYKKLLVNVDDANNGDAKTEFKDDEKKEIIAWKSLLKQNLSCNDYGNGKAEIIDYAIVNEKGEITNSIDNREMFKVKMKVRFNEDINEPIFAFTIKNVHGIEIAGTNTMYEHIDVGMCKKGEIREIEFLQESRFPGADYLISFGCTGYENAEFVVYHRLYDVTYLSISSDKYMVGLIDMKSEIGIREIEG